MTHTKTEARRTREGTYVLSYDGLIVGMAWVIRSSTLNGNKLRTRVRYVTFGDRLGVIHAADTLLWACVQCDIERGKNKPLTV